MLNLGGFTMTYIDNAGIKIKTFNHNLGEECGATLKTGTFHYTSSNFIIHDNIAYIVNSNIYYK